MMRRVGGLLVAAVIVGSLAAQKSKDLEVLQKAIEVLRARLKTQSAELEASRKKAAAKTAVEGADAKKKHAELYKRALLAALAQKKAKPAPVLIRGAQIKEWGELSVRPINPLLHGDYLKALVALARARGALDKIKDPKKARAKIDAMNRLLLDARRALWEFEQAAKKQAKAGDSGKQETGKGRAAFEEIQMRIVAQHVFWNWNSGHTAHGSFSIGRQRFPYVVKGGNNPLVRGGYRKALNKIVDVLKLLNKTADPGAARKALDRMSRVILDARRTLWEFEQKRKAATKK